MYTHTPSIISKLTPFFTIKVVAVVLVMLVLVFVGYKFFSPSSDGNQGTMVIHAGDFLQQVSVSGTAKAAQDVSLAFAQGGRIGNVSVSVGDRVYPGQVLAEVENADLRAQTLQKQAALESAQAKLASLKAGTRPEELAQAQAAVAQDQTALINTLGTAYTVADDAIHNKTDEIFSNPRTGAQVNFSSSNSQLKTNVEATRGTLESMLSSWQQKIAALALSNLSDSTTLTQQNLTTISQYLVSINTLLNSSLPNPSVTQTTLNTYTADAGLARTNVNNSIASVASAVSALDAASRALTLKQAGAIQTDIDAQAAQVKAAQADLANTQAQLAKTLITAPFAGVVTSVDAKVGQTAATNAALVSLISVGRYQVESYIPEVNIALVKVGNPATITLDAYGTAVFFDARIISIDPASQLRDGVSTYRSLLQFENDDPRIRAGMTANVVITTDKRSGVISVPQKIIKTAGATSYVYVREGGKNVKRDVTTGSISSVGTIEIISGLKDGDSVVLSL